MYKKEDIISDLVDQKICRRDEIIGCSPQEVHWLEESFSPLKLPLAYKEFLLAMGNGAGSFLYFTDIYFPTLDGMQDDAIAMLEEEGEDFNLPDDAIVFSYADGHCFSFFRASEGDDPPVYIYLSGQGYPEPFKPFSENLKFSMRFHVPP